MAAGGDRAGKRTWALAALAATAISCSTPSNDGGRPVAGATSSQPSTSQVPHGVGDHPVSPPPSVPTFEPRRITYRPVTGQLVGVVAAPGAVWVIEMTNDTPPDRGRLVRLDPTTATPVTTVGLVDYPVAVASGEGRVWVLTSPRVPELRLVGVDAGTGRVVVEAPVPGPVRGAPPFAHVAVGAGAVWVAVKESTGGHRLLRVDPRNGDVTATVPLPDAPTALALGRALFVGTEGGHLLRLTAGPIPRIEADVSLGGRVVDMAVDETAWVTAGDGTTVELLRLDPVSGQVAARTGIPVSVVAAGRGEVWVGDYGFPRPASTGFIGQVDPRDNTLVRSTGITTAAGNGVSELSIVDGTVWALNTYTSQLTGLATAG